MTPNQTSTPQAPPVVAFEVESFGWAASGRLEVTGRWFGLRGHRFMRPALMVETTDQRRRLLALLEHKPWAADGGELWIAAFAWDGEPVELTTAELSVAPSVAIELPSPRMPGGRARGAKSRSGSGARTSRARPGKAIEAHGERRVETLERDLAAAHRDLTELREVAMRGGKVALERLDPPLAVRLDGLAGPRTARARA